MGGINRRETFSRIRLPPQIQSVTIQNQSCHPRLYHQWYKRLVIPPVAEEDVLQRDFESSHDIRNLEIEYRNIDRMITWLAILIPSALFGATLGYITAKRSAAVVAAGDLVSIIVPFSAIYLWAYYDFSKTEMFWIIAVFVAGVPASVTSVISCGITQLIFRRRKNKC